MKLTIKGKELKLNNQEVKSAKKLVAGFMDKVRTSCRAEREPTYYFVVLLMMHIMSQDAIDNIDPESLEIIMNTFQEAREPGH